MQSILKGLIDKVTLILKNLVKSLKIKRYKKAPSSFKSERMRYIRDILPGRVLEIETELANLFDVSEWQGVELFPSNLFDFSY